MSSTGERAGTEATKSSGQQELPEDTGQTQRVRGSVKNKALKLSTVSASADSCYCRGKKPQFGETFLSSNLRTGSFGLARSDGLSVFLVPPLPLAAAAAPGLDPAAAAAARPETPTRCRRHK
ncbi:unnamed protein product [Arctogadus glacialis]